jgi:hypothetical protein
LIKSRVMGGKSELHTLEGISHIVSKITFGLKLSFLVKLRQLDSELNQDFLDLSTVFL